MDSISEVITGVASGFTAEAWLVAAAAVGVIAILWGVPLGVRFFKKLAK